MTHSDEVKVYHGENFDRAIERNLTFFILTEQEGFCGVQATRAIKEKLETKGFVYVPGTEMKRLLLFYGATEEDLDCMESVS